MNIENEFIDNFLSSEKPSVYLELLRNQGKLGHFPELFYLLITPQEPDWHPEGNVWLHTLMVADVAAELKFLYPSEQQRAEFMFGALCHDFGKPYTTVWKQGKFKSPMHDSLGIQPAASFLGKLGLWQIIPKVCTYILEHLKPTHLYNAKEQVSDSAILKLSKRIDIYDLVNLAKCDHWGRTDDDAIGRIYPAGEWLIDRYESSIAKRKRKKN